MRDVCTDLSKLEHMQMLAIRFRCKRTDANQISIDRLDKIYRYQYTNQYRKIHVYVCVSGVCVYVCLYISRSQFALKENGRSRDSLLSTFMFIQIWTKFDFLKCPVMAYINVIDASTSTLINTHTQKKKEK